MSDTETLEFYKKIKIHSIKEENWLHLECLKIENANQNSTKFEKDTLITLILYPRD